MNYVFYQPESNSQSLLKSKMSKAVRSFNKRPIYSLRSPLHYHTITNDGRLSQYDTSYLVTLTDLRFVLTRHSVTDVQALRQVFHLYNPGIASV